MKKLSPWRRFRASLADVRANRRLYAKIVAIVAAPVSILSAYSNSASGGSTLTAYITFAQLCMNAALIYAIIHTSKDKLRVREAYYKASGALVRLVLTAFVVVLSLLPVVFGLEVGLASMPAPGDAALAGGELALLIGVAVGLAIPSVFLVARLIWAIYIPFETELGPFQAIARSWRMTRGKIWRSLGNLVALGPFLLIVIFVPVGLLLVLSEVTHWRLFTAIMQFTLSILVLPIANTYMYRYYRELRG